jgi:predicted AAA+ superfamily ATPase
MPDEKGLLLEHFVAQELHRRLGHAWPSARLFHYRTKHGAEVDFVLEVDRELWGIEVKSTRAPRPDMLSGLDSLAERTPRLKRRILVSLAEHRSKLGSTESWPLREFLASLP